MNAKRHKTWQNNGYLLRPACEADAEDYYGQNYKPLDPETARLTGSKTQFTKEEVISFFLQSVREEDRYLFLLISPDGRIVGESVINEIDWGLRCANFRIAIYQQNQRGKGIGTWMTETVRDFAFAELKLHRLSLDVFFLQSPSGAGLSKGGLSAGRGPAGGCFRWGRICRRHFDGDAGNGMEGPEGDGGLRPPELGKGGPPGPSFFISPL